MAEVGEESLASAGGLYRLPEDTREEILALLPLDCLCKCRSVYKEWNALFSSTRFITNKWAETPSNKNPWLLLSKVNFQMGWKTEYSAYCFFTQTWKNFISFSFLPEGHKNVKCSGAAEGLFLVDIPDGKLTVCNPLTQSFLKLPSISSIKSILTKGIMGWKMDTQQTYKVVAVGLSHGIDEQIVEIYDSDKNSWRVAGYLPQHLEKFGLSRGIVFCDGCFYGTTLDCEAGMGVLGFSIMEGTSIFTPLPEFANGDAIWPKLLTCESRILLVGGISRRKGSSLYTVRKIIEVIL